MIPVFLLGPGRSGTTLLYKLLAAMPDLAYLSNYDARFPRQPAWALLQRALAHAYAVKRSAWFQDEGGAYFNDGRSWLKRIVPTPAEAERVYRLCGVPESQGLDIPLTAAAVARLRRRFVASAAAAGRTVLLSKRTADNRRVARLLEAFPEARFVCLLRDGRAVARSLVRVHWWADHTLFWCGSVPRTLVAQGHDELRLAARNWVEEMAVLETGMRLIPAAQRLELHYDELLAAPRSQLTRIHAFVGGERALPAAYWRFIESLGLQPPAPDWLDRLPSGERERIEAVQVQTLERWGFAAAGPALPPAPIESA